MTKQKIGIIGAGNIGGGLGKAWEKKGHTVQYGTRDTAQQQAMVASSDIIVVALPWKAVAEVLTPLAPALAGKVLVDCTNAVGWDDGPVSALTGNESAAQKIAELAPGARVIKAFNTLGAEHLATAQVHGQTADTFLAGDDPAAKATVAALAEDVGFAPIDLGPLRNARLCESIAIAWIHLAMKGGLGREIAFKVLR
jgi:8-hydroxy-5-deazaflavin:NADPH oxidoreductase